jgi:hypothetical protein
MKKTWVTPPKEKKKMTSRDDMLASKHKLKL